MRNGRSAAPESRSTIPGGVPHNIGTDCRVSIDRAARYIEAVSVFWLNYRHPGGRAAGVVVVESAALIQARMKAAVTGLDQMCRLTTTSLQPIPAMW